MSLSLCQGPLAAIVSRVDQLPADAKFKLDGCDIVMPAPAMPMTASQANH